MTYTKTARYKIKVARYPELFSVLLMGVVAPSLLMAGPDGGEIVGGSGSISVSTPRAAAMWR